MFNNKTSFISQGDRIQNEKKNIFSNLYKRNVNVNLDERNSAFQFYTIKENGYYS